MARDFFSALKELFADEPEREQDPIVRRISEAADKLAQARHSLQEEIAITIERLSDDINRCLQHQFLKLEWEERVRRVLALDPRDVPELGRYVAGQLTLQTRRVMECRDAANREESVVAALEKRLAEIDEHLERIVKERDMLRSTGELARSRSRIAESLEALGRATGLDFLEALETARIHAEQELALTHAAEDADEIDPFPPKGRR